MAEKSALAPALPCEPIQFGPGDSALFGWYHPPEGPSRSTGVVLCNPIGDDYVRAHRALRRLALELAAAGFAVLRFDFRGTGDSSGSERDPGCVPGWLEDVRLAVEELRTRSGTKQMAVMGLRLGGTLAMAAAGLGGLGVDSLVLWNPFPSGDAFVNEATKLHRMHTLLEPQGFAAVPANWNGGGEEALGFLLTRETIAGLSKVDLFSIAKRPSSRALILGTSNLPTEDKLLSQLRTLGVDAEYRHLAGQKFLVLPPHRAELPTLALKEIVSWLSEKHPPVAGATRTPSAKVERSPVRYGEEPILFGREHPLFGILVHPPEDRRDPKRPAIIMTSAGCIHRIGPHRFYVPMARRWAQLGFSVLRMDLSGIGDSPAAPGCEENLEYPRDGLVDIARAMDALEEKTGAKRFIVLGHCSGGDLAFQSGLHDPRVAGAMMLNPRTFCVNSLEKIEDYKRARYYQQALTRKANWKKALRGDVDIRRALGMVAPKFADQIKQRALALVGRKRTEAEEAARNVPASLRRMAESGVDTFLVATEKDPGVDYLDLCDGRAMQSLASVRGFHREDFLGIDHSFTSLYAQEKLSQVLTDHLSARHLA